ncbi:hypothetical protein SAMN04487902_11039 [Prevotella sp. ne3005]|nr:hypothetical protein SAMN04487902_11039 [Prevotella sp. ne3005]
MQKNGKRCINLQKKYYFCNELCIYIKTFYRKE